MVIISLLFSSGILFGILRAQNVTTPTDILQNMKQSLEAYGGGSLNFGPGGILGNLAGQFGLKINKEQTSSGNTAKLVRSAGGPSKLHRREVKITKLGNTELNSKSLRNMKKCFGIPLYVPVINIVTAAPPSTTTSGTPDARGGATTAMAG